MAPLLLPLYLAGCLDNDALPGSGGSFVAMQADFAGFDTWPAFDVEQADTGHVDGARAVYLNVEPADDATTFPVGTIIVKTIAWSGGTDVHAMAKRGPDYNVDGAFGWEWFELALADDGSPVIQWRGAVPPEGEQYGQLPGMTGDTAATVNGDCNSCHGAAATNDYVHSIPL